MALAGGIEVWGRAHSVIPLVGGLALVTVGAAVLGRSKAIARVSGDQAPAAGSRHRLGLRSRPPATAPDLRRVIGLVAANVRRRGRGRC